MTFRAISKLSHLSRQDFKYYIFQGTEPQWNPTIGTFLKTADITENKGKNLLDPVIKHQIQELINLKTNPDFLNNASQISLARLKNYIETKIDEYKTWNGEWF